MNPPPQPRVPSMNFDWEIRNTIEKIQLLSRWDILLTKPRETRGRYPQHSCDYVSVSIFSFATDSCGARTPTSKSLRFWSEFSCPGGFRLQPLSFSSPALHLECEEQRVEHRSPILWTSSSFEVLSFFCLWSSFHVLLWLIGRPPLVSSATIFSKLSTPHLITYNLYLSVGSSGSGCCPSSPPPSWPSCPPPPPCPPPPGGARTPCGPPPPPHLARSWGQGCNAIGSVINMPSVTEDF